MYCIDIDLGFNILKDSKGIKNWKMKIFEIRLKGIGLDYVKKREGKK